MHPLPAVLTIIIIKSLLLRVYSDKSKNNKLYFNTNGLSVRCLNTWRGFRLQEYNRIMGFHRNTIWHYVWVLVCFLTAKNSRYQDNALQKWSWYRNCNPPPLSVCPGVFTPPFPPLSYTLCCYVTCLTQRWLQRECVFLNVCVCVCARVCVCACVVCEKDRQPESREDRKHEGGYFCRSSLHY